MSFFIVLTDTTGEKPIYINADRIISMKRHEAGSGYTSLRLGDEASQAVRETPEQIIAQLDNPRRSGIAQYR